MHKGLYNIGSRVVTVPDVLFLVWILYSVSRCCFPSFECSCFYPYFSVAGCYLLTRYCRARSSIIFIGIICIGLWQSLLAFGQHFHWLNSNHRLFDITGSFGNPGQLGGFLAISVIVTICIWSRSKKNRYAILLILPVLIQGYVLVLSDSRAGWLAAMSGIVALWILKRKIRLSARWLILLCFSMTIVICGLYKYKPESANGRLLVWRVTMDLIADKPVWGHGVGGFNRNYMYYQANYFAEHPESHYLQYSDNIAYPYNEFLHILTDQGIIGLLLMLGLLVAVLKIPAKNHEYKATIIGYMVFAQFSYPSYVSGLLVLFPILLASIQNKPMQINVPRSIHWSNAVLLIVLLGYVGMEYSFRRQCWETIPRLFSANPSKVADAEQFAENHYQRLLGYPRMADIYGQYVVSVGNDSDRAKMVLNDLKWIVPTSELFCDLGDLHKSEQNWMQAVACYQTAHAMIPRRLTPLYKSFKAYCEMGDTISARRQVQKALSMPIRIEGTRTLKMKAEMNTHKY